MMKQVLLVCMPFGPLNYPSLALSLLKPLVQREGIVCDVSYLNVAFRAFIGDPDIYFEVARQHMVGEWVFAEVLFEEKAPPYDIEPVHMKEGYVAAISKDEFGAGAMRDYLPLLRSKAKAFVEWCISAVNWNDYDIIGFTSVSDQHVASLALAQRIKQRWPEKIIAFGGANCLDVMGKTLLRLFPFVDWVFVGEADLSFPRAITQWFAGSPPEGIAGAAYRRDGHVITQGIGQSVELDSLPFPDFDDYFAAVQRWAPSDLPSGEITLEFSRGCWWGEKHHCIFCGINGKTLVYRRKSPERAEAEIRALSARYKSDTVLLTDTILDMGFFKTLLPALSNWGKRGTLLVECKANLTREQVNILRSAGVSIFQPGIESLDTEILTYMHKGTTLLQNVQLLKWTREYGAIARWALLYGFPGEKAEAYTRMALLIPAVTHLHPPSLMLPIRLQRFSPLFERPQEWGMHSISAHPCYRSVYPFKQEDIDDLAYLFIYDFDGKDKIHEYISPLLMELQNWMQYWQEGEPPLLAFEPRPRGKITIYDTRPCRTDSRIELEREMALAYMACDARRLFPSLSKELSEKRGKRYCGDAALRRGLDDLVSRRLMLREGDWYLSLANNLEVLSDQGGSMLAHLFASRP
jgi:ribosomal peptide maturation radical SAM protein 1